MGLLGRGAARAARVTAGVALLPEDRAHLLAVMCPRTNGAVHGRMNALLLDDAWTAERVAEALFIEAETVRAHPRLYGVRGRGGAERLAYAGRGTRHATIDFECDVTAPPLRLQHRDGGGRRIQGRVGRVWWAQAYESRQLAARTCQSRPARA